VDWLTSLNVKLSLTINLTSFTICIDGMRVKRTIVEEMSSAC
jgi:hypothetical protein